VGLLCERYNHIYLKNSVGLVWLVKTMVLGQKLWEGTGKSGGAGLIKSVSMESITSEYGWTAKVKGMGCAEGLDGTINVTAISETYPKGIGKAHDQGIFIMTNGEMCVLKGSDLMKVASDCTQQQ